MKLREIFEAVPNTDSGRNISSGELSRTKYAGGDVSRSGIDQSTLDQARSIARARTGADAGSSGSSTTGNRDVGGTGEVPPLDPVDTNAPAGTVRATPGMNPLFTMDGASRMTAANAADIMSRDTLPRARRMAGIFGATVYINDAIAKSGTSREDETQGSQHFSGRGLDLNIARMSNEEKMRLVQAARAAGFRGFGFGTNILHVDTGPQRAWAYGNGTYAGIDVATLDDAITNGLPLPGEDTGTATV